jgi:putative membrane protein
MMSDEKVGDPSDRFHVDANAQSHFAWLRTRLAAERTMMAYMRTAVSLIGFGFAIFQFFYRFHQTPEFTDARFPHAAWYMGLALILCGTVAALLSILQHRWTLRYLWSGGFAAIAGMDRETKQMPLYAMAFLLVVIGLFAFFAVLLRVV